MAGFGQDSIASDVDGHELWPGVAERNELLRKVKHRVFYAVNGPQEIYSICH